MSQTSPASPSTASRTQTPSPTPSPVPPSAGPQTNPVDRSGVKDGGVLRLVGDAPANWNPWAWPEFDLPAALDAMTARLFAVGADGALHWDSAWLADAPVVSPQGRTLAQPMTVTYSLNPQAVWSDGTPMGAGDFVATWQACAADPGPVCAGRGFEHISDVTAPSPGQVVVTYGIDYSDWQYTFMRGPLRAGDIATAESREAVWDSAAGHEGAFSGPFRAGTADGDIVLQKNPWWWGNPTKLDTIALVRPGAGGPLLSYLRQDIDGFVSDDVNLLAQAGQTPGIQARRGSSGGARMLLLNCAQAPLDDKVVRKAVLTGLDRAKLTDSDLATWKPPGTVLNSPVWAPEQPEYAVAGTGYDPKAARAALDADGWVPGNDGMRTRNGQALAWDFLVPQGDSLTENEGFGLRVQLAALGIRLNLVYVDASQVASLLSQGQYAMAGVTIGRTTALDLARRYTTGNQVNYASVVVDALYIQAQSTLDPAVKKASLRSLAETVWDDAPVIPLYEVPQILLTRPTLANLGPTGLGTTLWENVGWTA